MARGPSGRVVIELDPGLKRELHASLVAEGSNLKEWFIAQARTYLWNRRAPDSRSFSDIDQRSYSKAAEDEASFTAAPRQAGPSELDSSQPGDKAD